MSPDRNSNPIDYESRHVPERPLSIYPDPESNRPFMVGLVVGTLTPALAVGGVLALAAIGNNQGFGFGHALGLILVGIPALDIVFRCLVVVFAVIRKQRFVSSLISGLLYSVVTGYLALFVCGGCVIGMF